MLKNELVEKKISELSEKIDKLYALESVLHDLDCYVYDKSCKYDPESGEALKDAEDNYIMEIADTPKNKLVTELIDYLNKKYL